MSTPSPLDKKLAKFLKEVKKGNQWHFGMKAHVGADADSGLVHTVIGKAANVAIACPGALLHGEEKMNLCGCRLHRHREVCVVAGQYAFCRSDPKTEGLSDSVVKKYK